MIRKPDIQYVTQFYSYGSEAKVLELKPAKKKQKFTLPAARPQQKIDVRVDFVAWAGIVVAIAMAILMVTGYNNYQDARAEHASMTESVIKLQNTNVENQQKYESLYNLDEVRDKALALGMIPMEEAQVVTIRPVQPEPEPEVSWTENISWFLKGLFA